MINSFFTEEHAEQDEKPKPVQDLHDDDILDGHKIKITQHCTKSKMLGIELENGAFLRGEDTIHVITPDGPKSIIDLLPTDMVMHKSGFVPLLKKVNLLSSSNRDIISIESTANYYINDILVYGENDEKID